MTDESLVDDPRMKPARGLVSDVHPIRPLTGKDQRPINRIGPDVTLVNGDEKALDDERPKRKLVDPIYDNKLLGP